MNNLRQLCAGLILLLALTSTVLAGKMDCPGVTEPPPEEITSGTQSDAVSDSTITDTLLILVESVLLVP